MRKAGNKYEDMALEFCLKNGFTFIKRNFYAGKHGEIDLIMTKNETLHFIEVKGGNSFNPLQNITQKKIEKLEKSIEIFFLNLEDNFYYLKNYSFCISAISIFKGKISFFDNILLG